MQARTVSPQGTKEETQHRPYLRRALPQLLSHPEHSRMLQQVLLGVAQGRVGHAVHTPPQADAHQLALGQQGVQLHLHTSMGRIGSELNLLSLTRNR